MHFKRRSEHYKQSDVNVWETHLSLPGIWFNVTVAAQTLAVSTFVPLRFRGEVKGLMGNFDGDPNNDYLAPDGTMIAANATEREIFTYASRCELQSRYQADSYNVYGYSCFVYVLKRLFF